MRAAIKFNFLIFFLFWFSFSGIFVGQVFSDTVLVNRMPVQGLYGKRCGHQIKEIFVKAVPHEKKLYSKRYFANRRISLQVTALYTYIRDALAVNEKTGRVLAAEFGDCSPTPHALQYPYEVEVVEVRGRKIYPVPKNLWDAGPGWVTIKKQGRYRIRVRLAGYENKPVKDPYKDPNPFRLGWSYSPVITVYDKTKDRGPGARVVVSMMIQKPGDTVPFETSSLNFDAACQSQPFKYCGRCDRELEFSAYAKWGIIQEESEGGGTLRGPASKPEFYKHAYWELVDKESGKVLRSWKETKTIRFRPSEFGDGSYVLIAYTKEQYHGKLGLQNFFGKNPARVFINIKNCGQKKKSPLAQTKTGSRTSARSFEKKISRLLKELEKPVKVDVSAFDKDKKKLVKLLEKQLDFLRNGPTPPIKKPDMKKPCEELKKQILERRQKQRIPCTYVLRLMHRLIALSAKIKKQVKELAALQNKMAKFQNKLYEPYTELSKDYADVIKKASKANLIIPPEVLKQFKRRSSIGTAPVIGDGLPGNAFVYNIRLVALSKELDRKQVEILTKWARRLREDQKKKKEFDALNKEISTKAKKFTENINLFYRLQDKLKRLYCEGTYEHCLGSPLKSYCAKEIGYTVEIVDKNGKIKKSPFKAGKPKPANPLNIPGLNIVLDLTPKQVKLLTRTEKFELPSRPKRWRLKGDGIWQAAQDRKLIRAVLRARALKDYANRYLTVMVDSVVEAGARSAASLGGTKLSEEDLKKLRKFIHKYTPVGWATTIAETGGRLGKIALGYGGEIIVGMGKGALYLPGWLAKCITKVPVDKLPNVWNAIAAMFTMTAEHLDKAWMAATRYRNDYYGALKKLQEWDQKYPDPDLSPPQINTRYVATALVALGAGKKIDEGIKAGVKGAIDLYMLLGGGKLGSLAKENIVKIMRKFNVNRKTAELLQQMARTSRGADEAVAEAARESANALTQALKRARSYRNLAEAETYLADLRYRRAQRAVKLFQEIKKRRQIMAENQRLMKRFLEDQAKQMRRTRPFQESFRVKTVDGETISVGKFIAKGAEKVVYDAKDPTKVIQIFKSKGKDLEFSLECMKNSVKALDKAGIPHPKFEIKRLSDGRVMVISERINSKMIMNKDYSKWTAEERAAFARMLKKFNENGDVYLDTQGANLYRFRDQSGQLQMGVLDIDAIAHWGKVRDFAGAKVTAEQIQAFMTYGRKIKGFKLDPKIILARSGVAQEATPARILEKYGRILNYSSRPLPLSGEFFQKSMAELDKFLSDSASKFIESLRQKAGGVNFKAIEQTLVRGKITPEVVEKLQKTLKLTKEEAAQLKKIAELAKLEKTLAKTVDEFKSSIGKLEETLKKKAVIQEKVLEKINKTITRGDLKTQHASVLKKIQQTENEFINHAQKVGFVPAKASPVEYLRKVYGKQGERVARAYEMALKLLGKDNIEGLAGSFARGKARLKEWVYKGRKLSYEEVSTLDKFFEIPKSMLKRLPKDKQEVYARYLAMKKAFGGEKGLPSDLDIAVKVNDPKLLKEISRKIYEETGVYIEFTQPQKVAGVQDVLSLKKKLDAYRKKASTLAKKIEEAEKYQQKLAKEIKPKKILTTEKGRRVAIGKELGRGNLGTVYVNAKDTSKIVKISKYKGALYSEKKVSDILKKAGIDHTEVFEHGRLRDGSYYSVQRRLRPEEMPLEDVLKNQGKKLTPEQQVAFLEFLDKLNSNRIISGDNKIANIYWNKSKKNFGIMDKGGVRQFKGDYEFKEVKLADGSTSYQLKSVASSAQSASSGFRIKVTKAFCDVYGDFLKQIGKFDEVVKALNKKQTFYLTGNDADAWIRYVQCLQVHGVKFPQGMGLHQAVKWAQKQAMDKIVSVTGQGSWGNFVTQYGLNRRWLNLYLSYGKKGIEMIKKELAAQQIQKATAALEKQTKVLEKRVEEATRIINSRLKEVKNKLQEMETQKVQNPSKGKTSKNTHPQNISVSCRKVKNNNLLLLHEYRLRYHSEKREEVYELGMAA